VGSTLRNKGVPESTRALTHGFAYNDLASLERVLAEHRGEFAAIILEPMNIAWPEPGFLEGVVALAREHGAVSVFDETITGYRFALGGAQQLFGVTPDLACFGKGLANGFPLSAVAGRAEIMREFEEVFFSFTMGGERLSLAAADAAIDKARDCDVPAALARQGQKVLDGLAQLVERHRCGEFLSVAGHPSWSFLMIRDGAGADQWEVRTLYIQEMLQRGILTLGTHNMSYAHSDEDVARLLEAYDEVLPLISSAVVAGDVRSQLHCEPLRPLFRVR
jgi:glutamate-1-semialdehyde 2,1-aminomutase